MIQKLNQHDPHADDAAGHSIQEERFDESSCLHLELPPRAVARSLTALVLVLAVVGAFANLMIYNVAPHPDHPIAKVAKRFDLGHEPSVASLYSSMALMACSAILFVITFAVWRAADRFMRHWFGLAIVFALLAIDETIMVHEMVDTVMHDWTGLGGPLYFAWVIPGGLFVLVFALSYIRFLLHLDATTRRRFVAAGAMFVAGAIGMEMVAGMLADSSIGLESVAHTVSQTVEETLEMLGVVLFMYALLDYLGSRFGSLYTSLTETDPVQGAQL